MTLEQQVISLPLAKRLKELGVAGTALFWYQGSKEEIENEKGYAGATYVRNLLGVYLEKENLVAAFTAAELGEMLPKLVSFKDKQGFLHTSRGTMEDWYICYEAIQPDDSKFVSHVIHALQEAEARGLMLAYLTENNLITI